MLGLNRDDEQTRAAKKQAGPAIGFGSSFAGGMALFGLGGHWLDGKTGKEPLFTLLGIGLGLLFGAWELWKLVATTHEQARIEAENKEHQSDEPPQ